MDCNICFEKLSTNKLTCGNNHYYHFECFMGLNDKKCTIEINKQKCLLCSQYITFSFNNILSEEECDAIINKSDEIGYIDIETNNKIASNSDNDVKNNKAYILVDDDLFS